MEIYDIMQYIETLQDCKDFFCVTLKNKRKQNKNQNGRQSFKIEMVSWCIQGLHITFLPKRKFVQFVLQNKGNFLSAETENSTAKKLLFFEFYVSNYRMASGYCEIQ